jgi:hypothetical protein
MGGQAAACQQVGLQIGSGWVASVRRFQALKAVNSGRLEQVAGQVVSPQEAERQEIGKKRFSGMVGSLVVGGCRDRLPAGHWIHQPISRLMR